MIFFFNPKCVIRTRNFNSSRNANILNYTHPGLHMSISKASKEEEKKEKKLLEAGEKKKKKRESRHIKRKGKSFLGSQNGSSRACNQ